jgi:hypothetical protein
LYAYKTNINKEYNTYTYMCVVLFVCMHTNTDTNKFYNT